MAMNANFDDFGPISWSMVEAGDVIYLRGTHNGTPVTYGPHVIEHVDHRFVKNIRGDVFMHCSEDLMKLVKGKP
jgi:hypothetical protein